MQLPSKMKVSFVTIFLLSVPACATEPEQTPVIIDSPGSNLLGQHLKFGEEGKTLKKKVAELKSLHDIPVAGTLDMEDKKVLPKIASILAKESILDKESDEKYQVVSSGVDNAVLYLYRGWVIVNGLEAVDLFTRFHNIYKASSYAETLPLVHNVIFENLGDKAKGIARQLTEDSSYKINSDKFTKALGHAPCLIIAGEEISHILHPDLEIIDLGWKQIALMTGPVFRQLSQVENLLLEGNELTSVPDLSIMTNLVSLSLSDNQLTSIPNLSALKNLQYLYLNNNQLTSVPNLSTFTKLVELCLLNNPNLDYSTVILPPQPIAKDF